MDDGILSYAPGQTVDAGSGDDIASSVDGAVAQAMARQAELASDTHGQGSALGDLIVPIGDSASPTSD